MNIDMFSNQVITFFSLSIFIMVTMTIVVTIYNVDTNYILFALLSAVVFIITNSLAINNMITGNATSFAWFWVIYSTLIIVGVFAGLLVTKK